MPRTIPTPVAATNATGHPRRTQLAQAGFALRGGEHPFMRIDAFYLDDPDGRCCGTLGQSGTPDQASGRPREHTLI